MRRDVLGDELHHGLLVELRAVLQHDERLRDLAGLLVEGGDDRGIRDLGMRQQQRLELGRRHLVALVLDELLEAVDDLELAVVVHLRDVAGVQEAVVVDGLVGRVVLAQVAEHDVRTAHPELAGLARALGGHLDLVAGLDVDELALDVGDREADGAAREVVAVGRDHVRDRAELAHAVALLHPGAEARRRPPTARPASSGAAPLIMPRTARQVVLVDERMLGERDGDRRRDEHEGASSGPG